MTLEQLSQSCETAGEKYFYNLYSNDKNIEKKSIESFIEWVGGKINSLESKIELYLEKSKIAKTNREKDLYKDLIKNENSFLINLKSLKNKAIS